MGHLSSNLLIALPLLHLFVQQSLQVLHFPIESLPGLLFPAICRIYLQSNMKEFVKIDATTFLMLKSPPPDLPAQKPPMACLSCKFHVMSYMDMMPQSWQDIPCSDMTCHTWACHGHGTSCHVPISCDHDMTSST